MNQRRRQIGVNAGEYEDLIPRILIFYFNWQNYRLLPARALTSFVTLTGYMLLFLPSADLFLRVLGTSYHHFFSPS